MDSLGNNQPNVEPGAIFGYELYEPSDISVDEGETIMLKTCLKSRVRQILSSYQIQLLPLNELIVKTQQLLGFCVIIEKI